MNIKLEIGQELRRMLDTNKNVDEIAQWADRFYATYCREVDSKLERILFSLSALSQGKEFKLSTEDLYNLAVQLISEGEREDLSEPDINSQKATIIDEAWLMCPICQEAWLENRVSKMVRCPKCKAKLYNPNFSSQD